VSPDYATLVATQRRLLGALSAEIATAIRNGRADAARDRPSAPSPPSVAAHDVVVGRDATTRIRPTVVERQHQTIRS